MSLRQKKLYISELSRFCFLDVWDLRVCVELTNSCGMALSVMNGPVCVELTDLCGTDLFV